MNPLFLVYCPTVRRLQGLSWPLPDCFVFVCLSLGPERRERDSKRRKKKSHSISWTDHWSGWLWHVMTQTASFLPLLSRRWPYKWCCRLPPYAIKHGVKQEGVLSPSYVQQHPDTLQLSLPALTFRKRKADYSGSFFSLMVLSIYCLFSPLPSLLVFYCLLSVGLRRGAGASLTGVWVLIAHVCALISGPQLPASSLLHASEWGYISLSLWPETFLSISLGLSPSFSLSHTHTHTHT